MRKTRHNDDSRLADLQLQRLARWLKEWELDQVLRKELGQDSLHQMQHVTAGSEFSYTKTARPLEIGEIRLLYPAVGSIDERPLYVALLEKRPHNMYLIAPFGRFAEPALPGEWLTGLKAVPLRVLCLWNKRVVTGTLLSASWKAGSLKAEKIRQAMEIYRHIKEGSPPASVSSEDIGPPLRHPLDPRHQYQLEEAELMEMSFTPVVQNAGNTAYEMRNDEIRLAAETADSYGKVPNKHRKKRPQK